LLVREKEREWKGEGPHYIVDRLASNQHAKRFDVASTSIQFQNRCCLFPPNRQTREVNDSLIHRYCQGGHVIHFTGISAPPELQWIGI